MLTFRHMYPECEQISLHISPHNKQILDSNLTESGDKDYAN